MANHNPNRVKLNRSYTFEELAVVLGVHKNTVSTWVKNGLPCLKEKRPFLVLGAEARAYLQQQRTARKKKCRPNELFCLRCKTPTRPAENFVEYWSLSATKGRLTGFCERCESVVNKFVRSDSLDRYSVLFNVAVPKVLEHINDCNNSLLNSDLRK